MKKYIINLINYGNMNFGGKGKKKVMFPSKRTEYNMSCLTRFSIENDHQNLHPILSVSTINHCNLLKI